MYCNNCPFEMFNLQTWGFPISFADKEVAYRGVELNEIQLAWTSTVHKAQGSECPVVVLVLSPNHRPLLTRRLLYTGGCPLHVTISFCRVYNSNAV